MEFKFNIGDVVFVTTQQELYGVENTVPHVIHERSMNECEGGVQRYYLCHAVGKTGMAPQPVQLKESLIDRLDIEAFKKTQEERSIWGGRKFRDQMAELEKLRQQTEPKA